MVKITTSTTQIKGLIDSIKGVEMSDEQLIKYINQWFMVD